MQTMVIACFKECTHSAPASICVTEENCERTENPESYLGAS